MVECARSFATGEETKLLVLVLATNDEYDEVAKTLDTIGNAENTSYGESNVLGAISSDIEDMVREVIGQSVEYEVRTRVADSDEQASAILDEANQTNCDHVFISGRRRSPTGKAVFGDRTQRVLLNFDGFVTVAME